MYQMGIINLSPLAWSEYTQIFTQINFRFFDCRALIQADFDQRVALIAEE